MVKRVDATLQLLERVGTRPVHAATEQCLGLGYSSQERRRTLLLEGLMVAAGGSGGQRVQFPLGGS